MTTQLGLGVPPRPSAILSTPLEHDVNATPRLPSATATPLGFKPAALPPDDESLWDTDDETRVMVRPEAAREPAAAVAPRAHTLPLPPKAPHQQPAKEAELELIEADEIPVSSSDAPTLDALMLEAGRPKPPPKPAPEAFLVNLSTGTAILGAPSIDVSQRSGPALSADASLAEDEPIALVRPAAGAKRSSTVPLFDMSAVLPAANQAATQSRASAAGVHLDLAPPAAKAPVSQGRARERKFVVAPTEPTPVASKARRGGAALWVALAAAAAGVAAVVGLRGHPAPQPANAEPPATVEAVIAAAAPSEALAPSAVAAPSEAAAPSAVEASNDAPSHAPPTAKSATPSAALALAPTATQNGGGVRPKESPSAIHNVPQAPATSSAPALEKPTSEQPTLPAKPSAIHNAPPPAEPGTEFDRDAARSALASAAAQASACRKDADPSGTATVSITFAPSGRVTSANLQGPPFAGTATGGCIASTLRRAKVPAFSGDYVTVTKTIVVQ